MVQEIRLRALAETVAIRQQRLDDHGAIMERISRHMEHLDTAVRALQLRIGERLPTVSRRESAALHQGSMELPKFKGGDPFWWILKINKFFYLNNTPPYLMVSIASHYMQGEAWVWFHSKNAVGIFTNWVEFIGSGFNHHSLCHQ
jgi:hypothetical protein